MLVVAALASASVALATPAQAESIVVKDARGDMGHKADVLRVRVAVKVSAERAMSGEFAHDWLTGRRQFTRLVARG